VNKPSIPTAPTSANQGAPVWSEPVLVLATARQGIPAWPVGQVASYHPRLELLDVIDPSTGHHRFVDAAAFVFAAV
jgi:hypothetical protein